MYVVYASVSISVKFTSCPASPLTAPPLTPPPEEDIPSHEEAAMKSKRKYKEKKQIIDAVTELKDGPGAKVGGRRDAGLGAPMTKDVSNILAEQHFLPRSSLVMRLLEIREDPLAHFLPTKVTPNGTFLCVAPPGLAPELTDMFLRPVQHSPAAKRRGVSPDKGANKKARLDGSLAPDDEIEIARRAGSLAPSILGSDVLGQRSVGPDGELEFGDNVGMMMDDFQLDLGAEMGQDDLGLEGVRAKSIVPTDPSRMSTPAPDGMFVEEGDETYADATCPISIFNVKPLTQTQGTENEADPVENDSKGYSKNTVKALGIIRKSLKPVGDEEPQDKMLSFRAISDRVCFFLSFARHASLLT
jgi:cohesin complex subunit SCC1